ncbi:histidine--tRNA ligase [Candidatus Woesearchaeota archaeon CG10_big_fil_rev_8_21_14_0_10_37_12]|nr:MAG: histidine--tRNA ligase [Candidatus Woesearchaeota archaeon CG10_big_fil_rev_8_21_14_0_10_37_12]
MNYQKPKGTTDFYPKEKAVYEYLRNTISEECKKFGFQQVNSPAFETVELLTAKSGEEIKQQLFVMEKRSNEQFALRFDLTVPLTRMFVTKQKELPKPVKWFAIEPMWRYEAPQKGREREFTQADVEIFGSNTPETDAQVINLIISCFERFGITNKDIAVKINNRKLLEGLLQEIAPKDKLDDVVRIIDKSAKISESQFVEELLQIGIDRQKIEVVKKIIKCRGEPSIIQSIKQELPLNDLAQEGLAELAAILPLITPGFAIVDLSVARGLAYYTGTVFEFFDKNGEFRALAGGGRYDSLIELFGGDPCPATGFGFGFSTLTLFLESKGKLPAIDLGPEYYVAPVNEQLLTKSLEITEKLREKTSADVDLMRRSLSKQIEYANSIGAKKIVIVGEKDLKEGKVTVRDLQSGKEDKVEVDEL